MKDTADGHHKTLRIESWPVLGTDFPADPMLRLCYYARLAPSSHNSQPWKFLVSGTEVDLMGDEARWLRAADPDKREFHVSLGCALESLLIAADYGRYATTVTPFPLGPGTLVARVKVDLAGGAPRALPGSGLLEPMLTRRTSHKEFEPAHTVDDALRKSLYSCFDEEDVSLHFLSDTNAIRELSALEYQADKALLANDAYRKELGDWIGEGMLGTPWLLSKLARMAVGHLPLEERVSKGDSARVASAPLMGLLTTRNDGAAEHVRVGQAFMRIALLAEAKGLRIQPVSQVLEHPPTREALGGLFGLHDRHAQHLFRIGHAPAETDPPKRRPLGELVIRST